MVDVGRVVQWVSVAGNMTRVLWMGGHVAADRVTSEDAKCVSDIVLMIPGNPGVELFYEDFGDRFLKKIYAGHRSGDMFQKNALAFCVVSHLNHVRLPNELRGEGEQRPDDRISLPGQIQHKFDFCSEHLSKSSKIVLVGHSIGSYIALKLLPLLINDGFTVLKVFGLFPTIERMASSPNGKFMYPMLVKLRNYDSYLKFCGGSIDYLPKWLKKFFCGVYFSHSETPSCIPEAATELMDINVIRNIVYMGADELETVIELDESLLEHKRLLQFYYGAKDGWCPIAYGKEMLERLGEEIVTIDAGDCEHAFVIKNGDVMAKRVADWVSYQSHIVSS
ncbi:unnamed protein product [Enterobius vermicularis]|uniref:Lipid droplet-associated hydrolase n=1 Tax=Enterobius vermicularis TaxID=51028 RepID=A0A0N4V3C1_ENTVE|nr:unnamed protein product [Enterobius vermicularis]